MKQAQTNKPDLTNNKQQTANRPKPETNIIYNHTTLNVFRVCGPYCHFSISF